jgi:hypothetical protein
MSSTARKVFTLPEVQGELENAILHFGNASQDCQYPDHGCVLSQGQVADLCALLSLVYGSPLDPPKTAYDIYNARKCIDTAHYDLVVSVYTAYIYQTMKGVAKRPLPGPQKVIFQNWASKLDDDLRRGPMQDDVKRRIMRIQMGLRGRPVDQPIPSDKRLLGLVKPIDIRGLPSFDASPDFHEKMVIGALRSLVDPRIPMDTPVLFFHSQFITLSYLFARYGVDARYIHPIEDFPTLRAAMSTANKEDVSTKDGVTTVAELLFRAYFYLYNPSVPGSGPSFRVASGCPDIVRKMVDKLREHAKKREEDGGPYAKRVSEELSMIRLALGGSLKGIDLPTLIAELQNGSARDHLKAHAKVTGFAFDARAGYVFKAIASQFLDEGFTGTSRNFVSLVTELPAGQRAIIYDAFTVFLISGHPVLSRKAAKWALPYLTAARSQASAIRQRNLIGLRERGVTDERAYIIGELQSAFKTAESDLEFAIGKLMDRAMDTGRVDQVDKNTWGVARKGEAD